MIITEYHLVCDRCNQYWDDDGNGSRYILPEEQRRLAKRDDRWDYVSMFIKRDESPEMVDLCYDCMVKYGYSD